MSELIARIECDLDTVVTYTRMFQFSRSFVLEEITRPQHPSDVFGIWLRSMDDDQTERFFLKYKGCGLFVCENDADLRWQSELPNLSLSTLPKEQFVVDETGHAYTFRRLALELDAEVRL